MDWGSVDSALEYPNTAAVAPHLYGSLEEQFAYGLKFVGESFDLSSTPGLYLLTYIVEPQSATSEAMTWLASWTATPPQRDSDRTLDTSDETTT
jgi:hypothetical protein